MGIAQRSLLMAAAVALIVLSVQLAWLPRRMDRLEFTGDEPHYLITVQSLLHDRDAEESNNYADSELEPHPTSTIRDGVYSKHGIGLPLLLTTPYAIGGSTFVLVFMSFIGAVTAANVALLAKRYHRSFLLAGAIGVALGLSSPLGTYGLLIFPEMPAALCVVYATRRLLEPRNTTWQWGLIGAAMAALPWLHQRFIFIVLALVVIAFIRHRTTLKRRDLLAGLATPIVAAIALFSWWTYLYGRPFPATDDHAAFSDFTGFLMGIFGLLIDQQWGVLMYSPLLILVVATMVPFVRWQSADALALLLIVIPYAAFIASFSQWYGGLSSPGRFLTALVPLGAAPLAWWLNRLPARIAWIVLGLFALPSMAMMALMIIDPHRLNSYPGGEALLFFAAEVRTGIPFTDMLPVFIGEFAWSQERLVIAGVLAMIGLAIMAACAWWMASRWNPDDPTLNPGSA